MKRRTFQIVIFCLVTFPLAGAPLWAANPVPELPAGSVTGDVLNVTLTPQMLTIIPALMMLIQMLKAIPAVEKIKDWMPLIAVAIAVGLAVILKMGTDPVTQIMSGVTMGLATAGGYDMARMPTKASTAAGTAVTPAGPTP